TPNLPVSISISTPSTSFCTGSPVTITATPANGGTIPVYQWVLNGLNFGTNNSVLTYNPLSGDIITCVLSSSDICVTGNPATSNTLTLTGTTTLPAGVTIMANPNPFCQGSQVSFTATPVNGGTNPSYQWKVNGANAGIGIPIFSYNPANNDLVHCEIVSNLNCVTGNPAISPNVIMVEKLSPEVSFASCFDTVTTLNAKPFKLKGGIPYGGSYAGPGVDPITGIFTPAVAGLKTINYTYTNVFLCSAFKTKTILVQPTPTFVCGNILTDIRDNKLYSTVLIGSQCWMSANLNYGSNLNSSQVQTDNCISEKYCYNDLAGNCTNYGGLYQWDEMMKYDDTPAGQGLCPPGWHIPTEAEWTTLFNFYLGNGLAGKPLQDSITSGFKAQTSGVFYLNSRWSFNGFATLFWSSTSWSAIKAISHGMNVYDFSVSLYPASRGNAFGVRCLRD
ncbi:MAG: FISUMP domain-containing protein, partial [Bacteroidota bacterium]